MERLAEFAERLDLRVLHVPSQPPSGWTGPSGRVSAELLDALLPSHRRALSYFVCGPPPMTDAALDALADLGVPRAAIRAERFALA